MEELIARVVAARQAAEAEHNPSHGTNQQAAVLVAQVLAILAHLQERDKPATTAPSVPVPAAAPAPAPPAAAPEKTEAT